MIDNKQKDYTKPEPAELQRKLDERMKKFLEKGCLLYTSPSPRD